MTTTTTETDTGSTHRLGTEDERTAYITGLRRLADALETDNTLPLPFEGRTSPLSIFTDTKAQIAAYARLMGRADKHVNEDGPFGFQLIGSLAGLDLRVYAERTEVCERRVTGTREVTEDVPDPDALAAVPTVTVTRTEDVVEWVCSPLLADTTAVA